MKTTLGVVIAVAAMMFGAGFANAAVSGNVAALRSLSAQSSPAQTVGYVHHYSPPSLLVEPRSSSLQSLVE